MKLEQILAQMAALEVAATGMELLLELRLAAQESRAKVLPEDWEAQELQDTPLAAAAVHLPLVKITHQGNLALVERVQHLA